MAVKPTSASAVAAKPPAGRVAPGAKPAVALADVSEEAVPKKKRSRALLIVVALLVIAGIGGGAWYFMAPKATATQGQAKAAPSVKPPVFVTLEPFTVNLASDGGGDHYLQLGIVLQVTDDKVIDQIKLYLPVLRNRVLFLLSAKTPSDLGPAEGKKQLVDEVVTAARESLPGNAPDKGVLGALLSSFVIQ